MHMALKAGAVSLLLAASSGASELVINGDFEWGRFNNGSTGWMVSGDPWSHWQWCGMTHDSHSGSYAAWFGDDNGFTYISELLPTIPGQAYLASLWIENDALDGTPNAQPDNEAKFLLNNGLMDSVSNSPSFGWTHGQFTFIATENWTPIEFAFRNGPGWWTLDDVKVDPVPEPQAALICGAGLALIATLRRRWRPSIRGARCASGRS